MASIHILNHETIDKIAAGEVVERPSSIVKELVENAVDAGASAVTVEIKDGGISFIRVSDNGCGIEKSEIRKAFLRHATSKIQDVDDLLRLRSLGFRGEALSSISAVSQTEMITKTKAELTGIRVSMEGATETDFEEIGAPDGTTIIVRNLFFNVPARRKFLKQPATEGGYVADLMEHLALANTHISFQFIQNNQVKFSTAGNGNLKQAVYKLYGRDMADAMIPIDRQGEGIRVSGYLGKPDCNRSNRNYEFYFLNGRFIKSVLVSRALEEGYKSYLMQHKYPFCVLMMDVDPFRVDVNVHPAKMEVRFTEEIRIFEFLSGAVKEVLDAHEMIPEVALTEPEKRKEKEKALEPFQRARAELGAENIKNISPVDCGIKDKPKVSSKDFFVDFEEEDGSGPEIVTLSKETLAGGACNDEDITAGRVLDEEGTNAGKALDEKGTYAGKVLDEEGTTAGRVLDKEGTYAGKVQDEKGIIAAGVLDEKGTTAGRVLDEEGTYAGKVQGEKGIFAAGVRDKKETYAERVQYAEKTHLTDQVGQSDLMDSPQRIVTEEPVISQPKRPASAPPAISQPKHPASEPSAASHPRQFISEAPTISEAKQLDLFEEKIISEISRQKFRILGQAFQTYWIVVYEDKLLMIDQHAAHEKVKYERIMKAVRDSAVVSQNLYPPLVLSLSGREQEILGRYQEAFEKLGFELEYFGGNEITVRSAPAELFGSTIKEMFLEVLDELLATGIGRAKSVEDRIATMACKAAVKGNMSLTVPEMEALLDELMTLDNPYFCPHGRPTIISFTKQELEKKFKRIV